jgi:hypothetical protein
MSALPTVPPLRLDHASLAVPQFHDAVAELADRVGITTTISPADPDRHGRVHVDRAYIEVSSHDPVDEWALPFWFLRFDDPIALRRHLDASGLPSSFDVYEGVDGRWDDVFVDGGAVPLPLLVRRTHPPEIARNWPPPQRAAHRCGATTLDAVHVTVPDLAAAADTYRRLVGERRVDGGEAVVDAAGSVEVRLDRGRILLVEGERAGVTGIVLGVASLAQTSRVVGPLSGAPVAWLDRSVTHGVRIGFRQP